MLVYTSFNGRKGKLVGIITVQDILRVIMELLKSMMSQQDLVQLVF